MFYVAFLSKPRKNVVIPLNWVFQHEKQLPKFVNSGLNTNQKHRLFFSENWRENDGLVQNYNANFDVDADEFPNEGCYEGNLIKFFANYDDAAVFATNRRTYKPAVYNEDRLVENPIPLLNAINNPTDEIPNDDPILEVNEDPNDDPILEINEDNAAVVITTQNDENVQDASTDKNGELNEVEKSIATNAVYNNDLSNGGSSNDGTDMENISMNGINLEDESLHAFTNNSPSNQNDPLYQAEPNILITNDVLNDIEGSAESVDVCVKPEQVLIVEPSTAIMDALADVIEEPEYTVHVVDDMEITVCNTVGYGRPFQVNADELVKRENDSISGNIPFNDTQLGSRLYGLGTYKLEIPGKIVETFEQWNTHAHKQNEEYDKRFVQALTLLVVNIDTNSIKEQDIWELIQGFIKVRAGADEERAKFMTNLADEQLKKLNAA